MMVSNEHRLFYQICGFLASCEDNKSDYESVVSDVNELIDMINSETERLKIPLIFNLRHLG